MYSISMSRIISILFAAAAIAALTACGNHSSDEVSTSENAFEGVIAVAAGTHHSLSIKSDGTVWAWGSNEYGQLGKRPDDIPLSNVPVHVEEVTDAIAIAAGSHHSLAITGDGSVWSWGRNNYGQLGDGTTDDDYIPAPVVGVSGATDLAAGMGHTMVLLSGGEIWSWGRNNYGQLGSDTVPDGATPTLVAVIDDAIAIAAGSEHSLAIRANGSVWTWGRNSQGQLGFGSADWNANRVPEQVNGISGAAGIAAGWGHSAVLKNDGTVWGWGDNDEGQLGDDTNINSYDPVQATEVSGATAIASGLFHMVALMNDGTLMSWGRNSEGQLGNGTSEIYRDTPGFILDVTDAHDVACGMRHCIAYTASGALWAWGSNEDGELGFGLAGGFYLPEQVQNP